MTVGLDQSLALFELDQIDVDRTVHFFRPAKIGR